jgi:hypothetical protein
MRKRAARFSQRFCRSDLSLVRQANFSKDAAGNKNKKPRRNKSRKKLKPQIYKNEHKKLYSVLARKITSYSKNGISDPAKIRQNLNRNRLLFYKDGKEWSTRQVIQFMKLMAKKGITQPLKNTEMQYKIH